MIMGSARRTLLRTFLRARRRLRTVRFVVASFFIIAHGDLLVFRGGRIQSVDLPLPPGWWRAFLAFMAFLALLAFFAFFAMSVPDPH
jgi:hypothetical protein